MDKPDPKKILEQIKAIEAEKLKKMHPVKARTRILRAANKRIMRGGARTIDKRRYPGRGVARKQRGDEAEIE